MKGVDGDSTLSKRSSSHEGGGCSSRDFGESSCPQHEEGWQRQYYGITEEESNLLYYQPEVYHDMQALKSLKGFLKGRTSFHQYYKGMDDSMSRKQKTESLAGMKGELYRLYDDVKKGKEFQLPQFQSEIPKELKKSYEAYIAKLQMACLSKDPDYGTVSEEWESSAVERDGRAAVDALYQLRKWYLDRYRDAASHRLDYE